VLTETGDHWSTLRDLLLQGKIQGPLVHDARVATPCLAHGVTELLTVDRDFSRFSSLTVRNPLLQLA
jgi:predicted nucleic acid-binding protein